MQVTTDSGAETLSLNLQTEDEFSWGVGSARAAGRRRVLRVVSKTIRLGYREAATQWILAGPSSMVQVTGRTGLPHYGGESRHVSLMPVRQPASSTGVRAGPFIALPGSGKSHLPKLFTRRHPACPSRFRHLSVTTDRGGLHSGEPG